MSERLNIIAYLHIFFGMMMVVGALLFVVLFGLGGLAFLGIAAGTGELEFVFGALGYGGFAVVFGGLFLVLAIPNLAAGYGILKRKSWGRIAGFIGAIMVLGSVPLGTILGIFTIITLVDEEAIAEFS